MVYREQYQNHQFPVERVDVRNPDVLVGFILLVLCSYCVASTSAVMSVLGGLLKAGATFCHSAGNLLHTARTISTSECASATHSHTQKCIVYYFCSFKVKVK